MIEVLKEDGRAAQSDSRTRVRRGGPPGQPVILFDYDPSRSGKVAWRLTQDFKGYLQSDGFSGYEAVGKGKASCMSASRKRAAQVRRGAEGGARGQPRRLAVEAGDAHAEDLPGREGRARGQLSPGQRNQQRTARRGRSGTSQTQPRCTEATYRRRCWQRPAWLFSDTPAGAEARSPLRPR